MNLSKLAGHLEAGETSNMIGPWSSCAPRALGRTKDTPPLLQLHYSTLTHKHTEKDNYVKIAERQKGQLLCLAQPTKQRDQVIKAYCCQKF